MLASNTRAQLLALIAVIFWSTIASAFKLSLRYFEVSELVFYSALTSLLFLLIYLLATNKFSMLATLSRQQYFWLFVVGLLNPLFYYSVLLHAYDLLPAQMAQSINYIWGIILSLLSVPLLGHKLQSGDLFALVTGLFGVIIIATQGNLGSLNFVNLFGVVLALASSVVLALYWILASRQELEPSIILFVAFLFATPLALLVMFIDVGFNIPNINGLFGALYIGVFEMGLTFLLWLHALKLTDNSSKIASLIFLSPILSFVFIGNIVGEKIHLSTLVGFGFILLGLLAQNYFSTKTGRD